MDTVKRKPVVELATHSSALARARMRVREMDLFWVGTTAVTAALAIPAFLWSHWLFATGRKLKA